MSDSRQQRDSNETAPALAAALERLRAEIDRVDRELLDALNRRAVLGLEVGRAKRKAGAPIYDAARERELVRQLAEANPGPFPSEALGAVYREIISATRALEAPLRVAYLGPEGTFGHQAARARFGASAVLEAAPTIVGVFDAVERGLASLGVVPLENTTQGAVTETLDRLAESPLTLCAELRLPVSQHLLSRTGGLEDVRRVASHPQALAQCRGWLDRSLPGVDRVEMPSTAAAARLAAEHDDVAAIASEIAAESYGLRTVARDIHDRHDNTTRFLVIGRDAPPPSGDDLTLALFTVGREEPGALHALLEPFATRGVNLAAIHARPIPGQPWEYRFFLDVEGHAADAPVAKALGDAAARARSHRVLGSFPRDAGPAPGTAAP